MRDVIRQIPPDQLDEDEQWERLTDDEIRSVNAIRDDVVGGWQVFVAIAEFIDEGPLASTFRQRMTSTLRSVEGVTSAEQEETETWFVTGTPSGRTLILAASHVVDSVAGQVNEYLDAD
ncbi:MAG: hypothetical protein ABJB47_11760 [Actinomycetota bacterium]